MVRRQPRYTLSDTLCAYTTLCRSSLHPGRADPLRQRLGVAERGQVRQALGREQRQPGQPAHEGHRLGQHPDPMPFMSGLSWLALLRSEEHTSELQSLMRISYAVFCLKKKKNTQTTNTIPQAI